MDSNCSRMRALYDASMRCGVFAPHLGQPGQATSGSLGRSTLGSQSLSLNVNAMNAKGKSNRLRSDLAEDVDEEDEENEVDLSQGSEEGDQGEVCVRKAKSNGGSGTKKVPWSPLEDSRLKSVIYSNSTGQHPDGRLMIAMTWGEIADMIPLRTPKQCRERWCYNLDPSIKRDKWSAEEDAVLIKAHTMFNNQWALIAKYLPGRTENSVKTRHKSVMRAARREWKPHEDHVIQQKYAELGPRWEEIKTFLRNRTANAVKTRFNVLKKQALNFQNVEMYGEDSANALNDDIEEGNARQIWMQPSLIKTIDLEYFVKNVSNSLQPVSTPRELTEVNVSNLNACNIKRPAESLASHESFDSSKRLRTVESVSSETLSPVDSQGELSNKRFAWPVQMQSPQESDVGGQERTKKMMAGFAMVNEAIIQDDGIMTHEKSQLLEQSQALLTNVIKAKAKALFSNAAVTKSSFA